MADEVTLPQPTIPPTPGVQNNIIRQVGHEVTLKPLQVGDIIMAEVDTAQLSSEHGDIRREGAEHSADIRYDVANRTSDIRREVATGFADTRYNIAERAGDIRREVAGGFDKTGDLVLGSSSDLRREGAEHTNEIIKEGLKESFNVRGDVKDTRFDVASRIAEARMDLAKQIDAVDDTLTAQLFNMTRDLVDNRVQLTGLGFQVRDGFVAAAKDAEINALKTQMEAAKNTAYLGDKIDGQAEKTRELINALNDQSLNRMLIERNSEIVEERHHSRHWRANYDNAQFAALTSQLNAFQSQLAETRQGMVNFGTMAGVGQTSTANNVR